MGSTVLINDKGIFRRELELGQRTHMLTLETSKAQSMASEVAVSSKNFIRLSLQEILASTLTKKS